MTGRELTSKADSFLNIVAKCLLIFPRSIRVSMFRCSRNMGGKIGIAWDMFCLRIWQRPVAKMFLRSKMLLLKIYSNWNWVVMCLFIPPATLRQQEE